MADEVPRNLDELYGLQLDLVKQYVADIPVYQEFISKIVDSLETYRMIRIRTLVRNGAINIDTCSFDHGFGTVVNFLTDLLRKE